MKIRSEFDEAKKTRKLAEPRSEDIQAVGWAKPGKIVHTDRIGLSSSRNLLLNHLLLGTPLFEGLDFKQAIARTPTIVGNITGKHSHVNHC